MRVTVLGSGSRGNSTLIEAGGTRILVDAGFSARNLAQRLAVAGRQPDGLDGIVVTHDHGDHTRGMGVYARRYGTALYLTEGTRAACAGLLRGGETVVPYGPGRPFRIGGLRIEPFLTVHDARDPVGVAVVDTEGGARLGIATDLGRPTVQVRHALSDCHVLILEANHDDALLHRAPYPPSVKARIRSTHGHLSNEAAARFVLELLTPRLVAVVLAHLSAEANRPELALDVVGHALRGAGWAGELAVADQARPTATIDVTALRHRLGPSQLSLL